MVKGCCIIWCRVHVKSGSGNNGNGNSATKQCQGSNQPNGESGNGNGNSATKAGNLHNGNGNSGNDASTSRQVRSMRVILAGTETISGSC